MELLVVPDGNRCRIVAQSPSGFNKETAELPETIHADVTDLQVALLRGALSRRAAPSLNRFGASADERMIAELGSQLYSFLFKGEIGRLYKNSLTDAAQAKEVLRIKLKVDGVRELATVPWEALYDLRTHTFLSAELGTLFTRSVKSDKLNRWHPTKLNILGMISGPASFLGRPLASLDVDLERSKIERCLRPLVLENKATLSWTMTGSYRELRRRISVADPDRGEGWTVFHFIGHGDFDEEKEQGYLIFEEGGGAAGEAESQYSCSIVN